jgi:hypothetical protein
MKPYKVYIAKLKRKDIHPHIVLKVGITTYSDAMDRINYRGDDECFPITNYFTDNKIMKASQRIYSEEEAKRIEAFIMNEIKGSENYFHNWWEHDQISGITEMRTWNYDEFLKAIALLDEAVKKTCSSF